VDTGLIIGIVSSGTVSAFVTALIMRPKTNAEIRKIDAEAIQTSITALSQLVVSLTAQLDACTKEKSELQQKVYNEGMARMAIKEQLDIKTAEAQRLEAHISDLEHTIETLKKI